ncbi:unnamed protein product [Fusarium fujikuroi]|uniref:Uncharacterized protein n=1 Tax=Fusarium fujikuroi TaxID=5127 RepID=A0A9Q9RWT2_FUSFU|nr:unnamed protein product [Fusarium fujikuroi]
MAKLRINCSKSALILLFDSAFPLIARFDIGLKLPGALINYFLEKSASKEKYLLILLATGINNYLGRKLTYKELVEEAIGYMFAGLGTISSILIYLLYEILKPGNSAI